MLSEEEYAEKFNLFVANYLIVLAGEGSVPLRRSILSHAVGLSGGRARQSLMPPQAAAYHFVLWGLGLEGRANWMFSGQPSALDDLRGF